MKSIITYEEAKNFLVYELTARGNTEIKPLLLKQDYCETFQVFHFEVSFRLKDSSRASAHNVKMSVVYDKKKECFELRS